MYVLENDLKKMLIYLKHLQKDKCYLIFIAIHCLISFVLSRAFFMPIKDYVGSENIAYKFYFTGSSLSNDIVVRPLCWIYSHILAIIFIVLFWKWIFYIYNIWKENKENRKYVIILLSLAAIGILTIIGLYPGTILSSPDTAYNYVYAKEWLPMYWHGFLTNIVHCASMIFFVHPIALSIVPFLFSINIVFYFTYHTIVKYSRKNKILNSFIWGAFLLLMPETIQALTYAGRNYVYVTLSLAFFGTILKDNLEKKKLTKEKFVFLCILVSVFATWRTEGIISIVFFPLILYFTYFKNRKVTTRKVYVAKGFLLFSGIYFIFLLPSKYGTEKYQGYDYFIINTPAPLSAVWASSDADLDYVGYETDLEKITDVCPKEYFDRYGEMATQYYNWDNARLSRQSNAGDAGKDFILGAYNILLHNWKIYLKYQFNVYFQSVGYGEMFNLQTPQIEPWSPADAKSQEFYAFVMDYYQVGSNDIAANYDVTFINSICNNYLSKGVSRVVNKLYGCDINWGGKAKIIISFIMFFLLIHSLLKKRWAELVIGMLIMSLFIAILLTAPSVRNNYFYYSYFNQYWFILFYFINTKKNKIYAEKLFE